MPTENRSSNTEQMVSLPLDLIELALAHLPSDSAAGFELRELLYRHPPTSDGFSAGDMADQGAKAFRDGQQAAIPEGFALVPKEMLLSKEVIGVINFHCGDTAEEEGGQFGQYTDGRLWVGNVTDDDGNQVHGLHIMTDEYPEEGSTTLVEFPPSSCVLPE